MEKAADSRGRNLLVAQLGFDPNRSPTTSRNLNIKLRDATTPQASTWSTSQRRPTGDLEPPPEAPVVLNHAHMHSETNLRGKDGGGVARPSMKCKECRSRSNFYGWSGINLAPPGTFNPGPLTVSPTL